MKEGSSLSLRHDKEARASSGWHSWLSQSGPPALTLGPCKQWAWEESLNQLLSAQRWSTEGLLSSQGNNKD